MLEVGSHGTTKALDVRSNGNINTPPIPKPGKEILKQKDYSPRFGVAITTDQTDTTKRLNISKDSDSGEGVYQKLEGNWVKQRIDDWDKYQSEVGVSLTGDQALKLWAQNFVNREDFFQGESVVSFVENHQSGFAKLGIGLHGVSNEGKTAQLAGVMEADFYQKYCSLGKDAKLKKLSEDLGLEDIHGLAPFLTDILGQQQYEDLIAIAVNVKKHNTKEKLQASKDAYKAGDDKFKGKEEKILDRLNGAPDKLSFIKQPQVRRQTKTSSTPPPVKARELVKIKPQAPEPKLKKEIASVKKEIFDFAENKDRKKTEQLLKDVQVILQKEKAEGKGKLKDTIPQTASEVHSYTRDGEVVFLPKSKGKLVVVGDIHGDLKTVLQILDKEEIIENLEGRDKSLQLVFLGDLVDRGPKSPQVMQLVLELKRRYPKNITIMKADHEVFGGVSPHDFNNQVKDYYGLNKVNEPTNVTSILADDYDNNAKMTTLFKGKYKTDDLQKIRDAVLKHTIQKIQDRSWSKTDLARELNSITTLQPDDINMIQEFIRTRADNADLNSDFFGDFFRVFEALPRMTTSANGYAKGKEGTMLVHGGPPIKPRTLREYADLTGDEARQVFDWQITWADPILESEVPAAEKRKEEISQKLERFLLNNLSTNDSLVVVFNENDPLNPAAGRLWELGQLKKVLKVLKDSDNIYFSDSRGAASYCDAVYLGLINYSRKGLEQALQKMGASFAIRGHQVSNEVDGDLPNLFGDLVWTIHSTGKGSSESYYAARETNPTYAVFQMDKEQSKVEKSNIIPVWTK